MRQANSFRTEDSKQPAAEIARILDRPPELTPEILRGDTRVTRRWRHGAIHDSLAGMRSHVIMTYYAEPQDIQWRSGKERITSKTRPGTITLIPAHHYGNWDLAGPIEVSHVYLTDERLQSCADLLTGGSRVNLVDRVGFQDPAAARILDLLSREAEAADPSSRLFVEQAIDLLCTQLVRGHSSYAAIKVTEPRRGLAEWQINRITSYMREHLDEEIGLEELASILGITRFHFCTAFRRGSGYTPHEWLVIQRMNRARELLADPTMRITDVALVVGYGTPSSFAAAFRKATGLTPTEFRQRL